MIAVSTLVFVWLKFKKFISYSNKMLMITAAIWCYY